MMHRPTGSVRYADWQDYADDLESQRDLLLELLEGILPIAQSYLYTYPDRRGATIDLLARASDVLND